MLADPKKFFSMLSSFSKDAMPDSTFLSTCPISVFQSTPSAEHSTLPRAVFSCNRIAKSLVIRAATDRATDGRQAQISDHFVTLTACLIPSQLRGTFRDKPLGYQAQIDSTWRPVLTTEGMFEASALNCFAHSVSIVQPRAVVKRNNQEYVGNPTASHKHALCILTLWVHHLPVLHTSRRLFQRITVSC